MKTIKNTSDISLQLPDAFITTMRNVFKQEGRNFLTILPGLIEEASQRWGLHTIQPVPNLSYNFVSFAKRGNEDVILKIGVPNPELTSEMNTLKLFNGRGTCQLLACDEEKGLLLIERLKPGSMLSELKDDDERTQIAVDVLQKTMLCRDEIAPFPNPPFIKLSDWFNGLKNIRPVFHGGTGPFPKKLLEGVESFLPGLFAGGEIRLLHGDFHHHNILSSERGWLAIDPKGVLGPPGYEIGPFMINPLNSVSDRAGLIAQTRRRVSILAERLGWEREVILDWAAAHALLSAWWDIQDGMDWRHPMRCAELFFETNTKPGWYN